MSYNNFTDVKLRLNRLDIYIVRTSIENSLNKILPRLGGVLLDVGCGQMPYKPILTSPESKVVKYIGLDQNNNYIHNNNPDITWKDGKIPLGDNSVDCAIATEVLEHCPEPDKIVSEISRVLKPEGLIFFTVPFVWPLHEVPYDEYRYTPFSIERILKNNGFSNIDLRSLGGWDASLAQVLGLWARRRPMNRWKRFFFSMLIMPFVSILYRSDKKQNTRFVESSMITGLSGTALKKRVN